MSDIESAHERFCKYVKAILGGTDQTVRWHKDGIKHYLKYTKIQKPKEMNQENIEDFLMDQQERGISGNTRRTRLQSIVLFVDWLFEKSYICRPDGRKMELSQIDIKQLNFARRIPRPKFKDKVIQALDEQEVRKVLYWAKNYPYYYKFERPRNYAMIATLCFTGMRRNELMHLNYDDVNIEKREILIQHGKGQKERVVPILSQLVPILENYMAERDALNRTSDSFFISLTQDKGAGLQSLKRLIIKLRKKTGIHFAAHKLRHTFASLLLQETSDLKTVSELLGHSTVAITAKHYIHLTTKHKRDALEKMPALI